MKIEVRSLEGDVLGTLEFEVPKDLEAIIYEKVERSPLRPEAINMDDLYEKVERSPLHPKAINRDDLKVGMKIRRHNTKYGTCTLDVGRINGEPFLKHDVNQGDAWMVPVKTTNYAGEIAYEDWFLAEMGVIPYVRSNGGTRWNEQNYTLAVK